MKSHEFGVSWATVKWTNRSRPARYRSRRGRISTISIWVVNCNLQRLDGPVRGNGKIIQELEALFRGAGWNVIKVIWGSDWDPLLAADENGLLLKRMEEAVDGEYQNIPSSPAATCEKISSANILNFWKWSIT